MKFDEKNDVIDTIFEIYNLNSFVKVKSAFDIGRIVFSFGQLDSNKKLLSNIDFYLDIKKCDPERGNALTLCNDILSGKINKLMDIEEKKRLGKLLKEMSSKEIALIPKDKKYAKCVKMYQGGWSAEKAKEKGRTDGNALSRVMKITRGFKKPVVLSCEEGAGKETKEGLIVPIYKSNPEKKIMVSLSNEEFKAMALSVQTAYSAWLSAKYSVKLFRAEREKRENSQKGNK